MPGIFGTAGSASGDEIRFQSAKAMEELLRYHPHFVCDPLFHDPQVAAGRCHTAIINKAPQPFAENEIFVWLDGELYNWRELSARLKIDAADVGTFLLRLYRDHDLCAQLSEIDGIFSAVIYDRPRKTLLLVNDRYGLRHLYFATSPGGMGWSSELKGLLALSWFDREIDRDALGDLLRLGYFTGDKTWFKSARLLPPATCFSLSLDTGSVHSQTYWTWDRIRQRSSPVDLRELGREWGVAFRTAMESLAGGDEPTGLTLSGGLDSRAILAAFPDIGRKIPAATFGVAGCPDIRIASQAASLRGASHHTYEITGENWLHPRIPGVWATDGQLNLLDMHGIEFIPHMASLFTISLNGLGGDGIHGGSFLSTRNRDPSNPDPYGDRGRRFIRVGTMLDESWMHIRLPFYHNKLVELTLSLPEKYRLHSRFYRTALLESFPEYFARIPWQKAGVPIGYPQTVIEAVIFMGRLRRKSLQLFGRTDRRDYTDYAAWLRVEPARSFFEKLLLAPGTIYPEYFDAGALRKAWEMHGAGRDCSRIISFYATAELWLQRALNDKKLEPGA